MRPWMEKWYMPRVWFSTRRRRGSDEITSHRPTPMPYAGNAHVSCLCTCGRRGHLLSGGAAGVGTLTAGRVPRGGGPWGGGPRNPDLAHEAEADEEEAGDEEQRPLPQRVQVVLEHEDWGRRAGDA